MSDVLKIVTLGPWPDPKSIITRRLARARARKIYLLGVDGSGKTTLQREIQAADPGKTVSLHYIHRDDRGQKVEDTGTLALRELHDFQGGASNSGSASRLGSLARVARLALVELRIDLRLCIDEEKRVVWARAMPDVVACPHRYRIVEAHHHLLSHLLWFFGRGAQIYFLDTPVEVCALRRPEERVEHLQESRIRYLQLIETLSSKSAGRG